MSTAYRRPTPVEVSAATVIPGDILTIGGHPFTICGSARDLFGPHHVLHLPGGERLLLRHDTRLVIARTGRAGDEPEAGRGH